MPLKYKKLIILFSLGIMLIGLGTFSMLAPNFSMKHLKNKTTTSDAVTFGAITAVDGKSESTIQSEIDQLVADYMDAKQRVAMEDIATYVSDAANVEENKLLAESEYVERYENIQCKILDGAKEGSYRVYAYYDVKIYDIDTTLPSLTALYINQNEDKKFQIYLGTLDSEEQQVIEELDNSPGVTSLVQTVQKRLEGVVSSDSKVREFYDMLESVNESEDSPQE